MIPAHASPTTRLAATAVLVTVAVAASMLALTTVILPGAWVSTGLIGVALVGTSTAVVRELVERRRRTSRRGDDGSGSVLPTLAGCAVALWYVVARFGSPTGGLDVVVGPEHLGRTLERVGEAGEIIRSEVAPVPGSLPVALLAVGGTLLVHLLADALAGGLRRPAVAGAPMLALWCPPLVLTGRVQPVVFVVTVVALLLLLTLDGPVGARARRRGERLDPGVRRAERARSLVTTTTAASVTVVALLVGSASSALPGVAGGWYRAFTTTGDTIRLSEDLDILRSLTERSNSVVLTYRTDSGEDVGPLRSYTATAFDGRRWQRGADRAGRDFDAGQVLWPGGLDVPTAGTTNVTVTVGELRDDKLPLPTDPRELAVDGGWGYDEVRDEVVGDRTDPGQVYELGVHERELSPDVLRAAPAPEIDPAYTELPTTQHGDDVAALAREVAGDADNAYDQAVALQGWFRDPSVFTYATELPRGSTGDPVWDFLDHRTGYCLQFATTMVVMARSLGIPARLAVGHLPGTDVEEGTWEIRGQDSHAWPELYFEGAGWVRFEPTPAVQTGVAPTYTNPATGQDVPLPVPTGADEVPREQVPPPEREDPAATAVPRAGGVGTADAGLPGWTWVVAGVGGVLVLAGAVLLLVRRRTVIPLVDPERAWQRVVSALREGGIELPPPTTLRRAPEVIAARVESRLGAPLPEEVLEDLVALADAAEAARYARTPGPYSPSELETLADSVTDGLTPALATRS
ncbi:transglutaminase domain-containing protein [Isoptericola variabilis]|uniref:Transglutaminase domain-containing protein n=1 Tax=Isoptericola variabilis (strain 225) TaxID=743718 RepID=F6FSI0_ISOV2|nr:transglutaminase domain-containing protein [Isoptericola variabilis]AEG44047.1 transglutaminase domain-containing protein [Isoptericola variabilis 225]TWH31765.1 Transglutaminase-like enzymes, putative cysteine proteases [Isoptericola variabilis J7]